MPSHLSAAPNGARSRQRSNWRPLSLPLLVAAGFSLSLAGMHLAQRLHSSGGFHLDFLVVSRIPFQEETPRIGQLTVIHANGEAETLESRCYASAFLDLRSTFRFEIADGRARRFVFSPSAGDEVLAIIAITFTRSDTTKPERVPLEKLVPLSGAELLERDANHVLVRTTRGQHPAGLGLAFDESQRSAARPIARIILETVALFLASFALFFAVGRALQRAIKREPLLQNFSLRITTPFVIATALILAMALCSKFNAHPDEYLHFETARYFAAHWLPPALNDPAIARTFSHYGYSYMRDLDASYFLMGKFIASFPAWLGSQEMAARLFNVLLFVLLSAYVAVRLGKSLAPFILLVSPQVWYVYSYVNGDAWALAIAMLIVVQLADQKSALQHYLRTERWSDRFPAGLGFALLLALLIMAKRNYYLFFPFIALVAGWSALGATHPNTLAGYAKKWAVIAVLTAALYFPLRIGHEALNGFEMPRLQLEQAEKYAAPHFKPSEIAAGRGAGRLVLRKRGVTFSELLTQRGWLGASFQSFCGVYKWMTLKDSDYYYFLMGILYASLVALLLVRIVKISWKDAIFAAAFFGIALSVILVSAYHSWTADYQPQGRYLFPILPMFAFLFYYYRERLRSPAFYLLFICLFACSVYSFIFTGLRNIPK